MSDIKVCWGDMLVTARDVAFGAFGLCVGLANG